MNVKQVFVAFVIYVTAFVGNAIASEQGSTWKVWTEHSNTKIWKTSVSKNRTKPLKIFSARNEWESFQVAVSAVKKLEDIQVGVTSFTNEEGKEIAHPTVYREHYYEVKNTANQQYGHLGLVPDALVPIINPADGKPTAGKYGGKNVSIESGDIESFWIDLFIPEDTKSGLYTSNVTVSAKGADPVKLQVVLEVFDFALAKVKHLAPCFETSTSAAYQMHGKKLNSGPELGYRYDEELHKHYINSWSPGGGWGYGLNGLILKVNNGKLKLDWSRFDEVVEGRMDGTAYKDKVPAQCLFAPYWYPMTTTKYVDDKPIYRSHRAVKKNYESLDEELFKQYVIAVRDHFRDKGWLDRSYFFYFDEPFLSGWKYEGFKKVAKIVKEFAPELRIMITDGYRLNYKSDQIEVINKYVDTWNPVTFQVSSPELMKYYQDRKKAGKRNMWCETLANANPRRGVINLFPEYDMPFHRMWGILSWKFGFEAIESWETAFYQQRRGEPPKDPWLDPVAFPGFRQPINGDGRLFFPGTKEAIGGEDIPIASLRMKAVREAVEDYEYLYMLTNLIGEEKVQKLTESLHTTNRAAADKMVSPMPMGKGPWHWWEGDPDSIIQIREKIARAIVAAEIR